MLVKDFDKTFSIFILLGLFAIKAFPQQNTVSYFIDSIHIQRGNVFEETGNLNWTESSLNKYHLKTKEKVISRELLFKVGDTLDMDLIKETERSLRKFDFLGVAKISIDTLPDHKVEILVRTEDMWSLIPEFIIESGGGLIGLGGSIEESNLLGLGKTVYAEAYNESDVGTSLSFGYYDPRLFGSRWRSGIGYSTGPLNETFFLSVYKPYFYSDSKWTYGFDFDLDNEKRRIFNEGKEISRVLLERTAFHMDAGYAFGKRYKKKRIKLAYRFTDRNFSDLGEQTTTPVPEDEVISTLSVGFSFENHNFAKEKHIDNFRRTEDFTLGRKTSFRVGKAGFPVPVGVDRWEYSASHFQAFRIKPHQYIFMQGKFSSWVEKNTILGLTSKYYWKPGNFYTLAINMDLDYAWNLEEHRQFLLGGDNGLRGYKAREFGGDKRFLANFENRIFPSFYFLTVEFGTVIFMDTGYAWKRNESLDFSDLKYSAGFGFRFGFTKAPGATVARIDFGFPINHNGGMEITFGIGQHFKAPK